MRRRLGVIFTIVLLLAQAGGVARAVHHLTAHRDGHVSERSHAGHDAHDGHHHHDDHPSQPGDTPDEDCDTCDLLATGARFALPAELVGPDELQPNAGLIALSRDVTFADAQLPHPARGPPLHL